MGNMTTLGSIALYLGERFGLKGTVFMFMLYTLYCSIKGFHCLFIVVLTGYVAMGIYATLRSKDSILTKALIGSFIYYLITNYGVWQFTNWYLHTTTGLYECMILGIPYFKFTLLGNIVGLAIIKGVEIILSSKRVKAYIPLFIFLYLSQATLYFSISFCQAKPFEPENHIKANISVGTEDMYIIPIDFDKQI